MRASILRDAHDHLQTTLHCHPFIITPPPSHTYIQEQSGLFERYHGKGVINHSDNSPRKSHCNSSFHRILTVISPSIRIHLLSVQLLLLCQKSMTTTCSKVSSRARQSLAVSASTSSLLRSLFRLLLLAVLFIGLLLLLFVCCC